MSHPDVKQAILEEVGSNGRQLGRIGDALGVLLRHVEREKLTRPEKDALTAFAGQHAQIRQVKRHMLGCD